MTPINILSVLSVARRILKEYFPVLALLYHIITMHLPPPHEVSIAEAVASYIY
jgi:hypothetical protein